MIYRAWLFGAVSACALGFAAHAETITIATVNNGNMIRIQKLTDDFTKDLPDIDLEWVTLEENVLRQRVTTNIATKGGQYDVMTIGNYEVPIWGKQGWLMALDDMSGDYDKADLLPAIAGGLSMDDKLYGAPFYGESAMVTYRTDLAEKVGIDMSDQPTWGENMTFITAMSNSYGARWFDMDWKPQFDSPEWKATLTDYLDMMKNYGSPGSSSNGFNENLALFQQGKCGMWIDATVAASFVTDKNDSTVADSVGFAQFPNNDGVDNHGNWLWSWNLAIPASTKKADAAKAFVAWATSKRYTELVASKAGPPRLRARAPRFTRTPTIRRPRRSRR